MYVPKTREDLGIPEERAGVKIDYDEYFGDTPVYTRYMLVRQQLLAFPAYLRKLRPLHPYSSQQSLWTADRVIFQSSMCLARRTIRHGLTISIVGHPLNELNC